MQKTFLFVLLAAFVFVSCQENENISPSSESSKYKSPESDKLNRTTMATLVFPKEELYVIKNNVLYGIDIYSGSSFIVNYAMPMDVLVSVAGRFYGIAEGNLYEIFVKDGSLQFIGAGWAGTTALTAGRLDYLGNLDRPCLYALQNGQIYRYDITNKTKVSISKGLPNIKAIASWDNYVAVVSGDALVLVHGANSTATTLNSTGWANIQAMEQNFEYLHSFVGGAFRRTSLDGSTFYYSGSGFSTVSKLTTYTSSNIVLDGDNLVEVTGGTLERRVISTGWTGTKCFAALD